ncbi:MULTISPECIES: DUF6350 family protein [Arthrobacter]|uniref:DUF6350 family protein n=2 Tax=Arthrobacter TaxID=1663 RepID=A0ABU9KL83_9MICC|nr:DUF6350 family protein [Arthrobacter sp. YJM1]MDP5227666.1 DUF6350 family protein [Arthrobacter sp. YJM1]
MKLRADQSGNRGLPMPLWLQGALESAQSAILSALLVLLFTVWVWASGGLGSTGADFMARLAGQAWLLIHGVPLTVHLYSGSSSAQDLGGPLTLLPWGLALIPFLLSWRAGKRLARASYSDQLWQAALGALLIYGGFGFATAFVCGTEDVKINLVTAALLPLVPVLAGLTCGARRESRSWSRLIGVEAVDWISRTSQHSRWAGSYMWTVVRAAFLAIMAALSLSALLLVVSLAVHWAGIVSVYQGLGADVSGAAVLTLAQAGYLPHLVVYTLSWLSGAGFSLGTGSAAGAFGTAVGPVPAIPVLAAVPAGPAMFGPVGVLVPVIGGVLAGWWFLREGENHFDEWLSIRIRTRWFTATVSTVVLAAAIGAVGGVFALLLAWVSRGSLGLGRLSDIGPDPLRLGVFVAVELAAGTVLGHASAPWLERRQLSELPEPAGATRSSFSASKSAD